MAIGGGTKAEIIFAKWWNYKDGGITLSLPPPKETANGCSCQSVENQRGNVAIGWLLGFLALGFFWRRKMGVQR
jgi:MYXO-CTERM domain-containing protein